jgi:hypothetical protein
MSICKNSGIFYKQILIQNTGRLNVFSGGLVLQHGIPARRAYSEIQEKVTRNACLQRRSLG